MHWLFISSSKYYFIQITIVIVYWPGHQSEIPELGLGSLRKLQCSNQLTGCMLKKKIIVFCVFRSGKAHIYTDRKHIGKKKCWRLNTYSSAFSVIVPFANLDYWEQRLQTCITQVKGIQYRRHQIYKINSGEYFTSKDTYVLLLVKCEGIPLNWAEKSKLTFINLDTFFFQCRIDRVVPHEAIFRHQCCRRNCW